MNVKKLLLTGSTVIALIVIVFAIVYVFRPAPSSVGKARPKHTITASNLVSEFEANENLANSHYLDKVLEVTGTVNNIAEDQTAIIVTLKEAGREAGVLCSFDKSNLEIDAVRRGDKIVVRGVCAGYLLDVVLTKCILVN